MKIVIILGPPGVGKGTQSSLLSEKFKLRDVSTGSLIRNRQKHDKLLRDIVAKGNYVSDELVSSMVKDEIIGNKRVSGFILDGYPRTKKQAYDLNQIIADIGDCKLFFINLELSEQILITRLSSRFSCKDCGTIYNSITSKPKVDNICDKCKGSEFITRSDDNEHSIKKRLKVFSEQTKQIIDFYKDEDNFININANKSAEEIHQEIYRFIKSL